jgi:colicin import membrane protein
MAGSTSTSGAKPKTTRREVPEAAEERLPKWVLVSLLVHGALIVLLLSTSFWSSSRREPPPSYVVDLVGGERIGGRNLGTKVVPESSAKAAKSEAPPPSKAPAPKAAEPAAKKPAKAEKTPTPEKIEKVKAVPNPEVAADKPKAKVKQQEEKTQVAAKQKTKEAKDAEPSNEDALEKVRERVMQAAMERARSRAAAAQSSPSAASAKNDQGEPLSAGSGEGLGAQSLGKGGVGGEGVLKSVEFIAYQNRLVNTIKANWAWAGRRSDLKVVVQFGIRENGEVSGLRVVQRSGDPTYDESVIRAIKRSSPFTSPPEAHRKEFADVEMTFKPSDFGA